MNQESKHFDTALNAKSYLVLALIFCAMVMIALNIYQINSNKKTEAPTSVTHNINS